jgi:hypothetical protein
VLLLISEVAEALAHFLIHLDISELIAGFV